VRTEAVVAAISRLSHALAALLGCTLTVYGGVLPEDRADALYHSYDGGGVEVTGPSILVRKGDAKTFSVTGNYYADSISSASIDVVTQGSPYSDQRTQWSGSVDYLHADTSLTAGYTNSDESDYKADTYNVSLTQTMFGALSTVTLGYSRGFDDIFDNTQPDFKETADHRNYHVSLSQVLSKTMILGLNYDAVTDEGYLQNPYRNVLVLNDPDDPSAGFNFNTAETYPNTRTSNAVSANLLYYLPYRASLRASYRFYTDDWDIDAHTAEIGYTHPLRDKWIFEVRYRFYRQSQADFYGDVFNYPDQQNFMARDKELSRFNDHTLGFGVSYNLLEDGWGFVDRASANFKYDHIWFYYDNFTDITKSDLPSYEFDADVIQLFVSAWY
jgi:hypothetical protein